MYHPNVIAGFSYHLNSFEIVDKNKNKKNRNRPGWKYLFYTKQNDKQKYICMEFISWMNKKFLLNLYRNTKRRFLDTFFRAENASSFDFNKSDTEKDKYANEQVNNRWDSCGRSS